MSTFLRYGAISLAIGLVSEAYRYFRANLKGSGSMGAGNLKEYKRRKVAESRKRKEIIRQDYIRKNFGEDVLNYYRDYGVYPRELYRKKYRAGEEGVLSLRELTSFQNEYVD